MPKDITILIVDDFSTARRIVKNMLKDFGFSTIVEAENGVDAIKVLEAQKIHLIFSDWDMPEMTGLDLLKWVRSNQETKDLPFFLVTSQSRREDIWKALKAGASHYIVKPFTSATLLEKIQQALP